MGSGVSGDDPFSNLEEVTGAAPALPPEPPPPVALADYRDRRAQAGVASGGVSSARKSRFITAAELAGKPIPTRRWLVADMIPEANVTLLAGDGGTGKSQIALQLAVACALGSLWLGRAVSGGAALYLSAEDDDDELHRRLDAVVRSEGVRFEDLYRLVVRSLASEDALLAVADSRTGALRPSALYNEIDAYLGQLQPTVLILDTLADLYPGNENDRAQARAFVGLLRRLAKKHQVAVLMLSHPSLYGLSSGTGTSGSTGWRNSVRSAMYLRRVLQGDEEPNPDARVLSVTKANYTGTGAELALQWSEGVFVAPAADTTLDRRARQSRADRKFLELLDLFRDEGRQVNCGGGQSYAPTVFSLHPQAEGVTREGFRDAMNRLLANGRVKNVETGKPSRRRAHLEVADQRGANPPADPTATPGQPDFQGESGEIGGGQPPGQPPGRPGANPPADPPADRGGQPPLKGGLAPTNRLHCEGTDHDGH